MFTILNQYGITYDEKNTIFCNLSSGQRMRINFAISSISQINTLIFDESTNHLDIEALEAIEHTINSFDGITIVISHDRQFIDNVNFNKQYLIENGQMNNI